jgi:spermidine synthase
MTILCEVKTKFHNIRIEDEDSIRTMYFGKGMCSEQSAIHLVESHKHVFDYSLLAMHSLLFNLRPSNILIVGLGGGVIPKEMEKYTSSNIDVIEIDPEVVRLSKEYFFFKETDRLKVYIGDAFDVVKTLSKKYDIVILDAFLTNYIPFHIMSIEFFKSVYNVITDDGLVAVNVANMHPSYGSQINTIRKVFGDHLYFIDGIRNPVTTMLFSLKKDRVIYKSKCDRPICHFLGVQPEKLVITDEIKNAQIICISKSSDV